MDFYFNLMGFGKEMLYLRCLCLCWKPLTGRAWGRYIYIKGVTVRFGFDAIRTSQTLRIVKDKATGTPYGMYIIYPCRCMAETPWLAGDCIFTSAWGFQRCSFRQSGQCEGLNSVERAAGLAPRFYMYPWKSKCD